MKKTNAEQYIIFLLLLMFAVLPPLVYTTTGAQTLSIGIMLCSLTTIFVCRKHIGKLITPNKKIFYATLLTIVYMLIQHLITGAWNTKSYLSIPILLIMLTAAYLAAKTLLKTNPDSLKSAINKTFYTCCFIVTFNIITQYSLGKILGYTHPKSIFPFLEPSHFATFFGVFFLIFFISNSKKTSRLLALAFTLSISVLIPNTTMLTYVGIAIIILIMISKNNKIIISIPAILVSAIVITNIIITDTYFTDRLNFSEDNTNTSALVYMQGLDDTKNSLALTDGLGLGFQMLGTQPASIYSYSIAKSMGSSSSELNRSDGGFFAAKVVSEFGLLGIIFITYLIFLVLTSFNQIKILLNTGNQKSKNFTKLAAHTTVIAFIIEAFVRGAGYFSPGFFIFISSVFFIIISSSTHKKSKPL